MRGLQRQIVVVGGGLAGLSASIAAADAGARVTLLEKTARVGGNSAKATSGINGWGTAAQRAAGVDDSAELLAADTLASGAGGTMRPPLIKALSERACDAIEWLSGLGVPLSVVSQLGGHSRKRSHRAPDRTDGTPTPIGFTIMSTLEKHVRGPLADRVTVLTGATVEELLSDSAAGNAKRVRGVRYKLDSAAAAVDAEADAVVLCTGGFSNDHTATSLLSEYAPELVNVPTTNGPFATGDGVKMARRLGAGLVDMDKIQLHPTGFVNPKDPNAATKFLGPEALRGSGGVLLNGRGERFVDELNLRSVVTAAIHAQGDVFPGTDKCLFAHCVLSEAAAELFGRGALSFYWQKMGLFQKAENVTALAALIGCSESTLLATLTAYDAAAAAGKPCPLTKKKVFPSLVGTSGPFYVAAITPSIHYTMGGCAIDDSGAILDGASGLPIAGLFGAGEVTGGVHGANRLGGNSLLECAVFGRIAGVSAAK